MKKEVALVLSGGGARGIAHIGVIEELEKNGYEIKSISLMTYTIAQMAMEKNPPDLLINVSKQSAGTYDFFKAEELIEMGRIAAQNSLKHV